MTSPTIIQHRDVRAAYAAATALMSDGIASGRVYEIAVEPWRDGWRLVYLEVGGVLAGAVSS